MKRGRVLIGLVLAFLALVLAPVIENALDRFSILAIAVLVAAGLAIVWRALAEPLE